MYVKEERPIIASHCMYMSFAALILRDVAFVAQLIILIFHPVRISLFRCKFGHEHSIEYTLDHQSVGTNTHDIEFESHADQEAATFTQHEIMNSDQSGSISQHSASHGAGMSTLLAQLKINQHKESSKAHKVSRRYSTRTNNHSKLEA